MQLIFLHFGVSLYSLFVTLWFDSQKCMNQPTCLLHYGLR